MKPCERTATRTTIQALEEAKFDVALEFKKHIQDVDARIEAEENKNKTSKAILQALLKEREQTYLALLPYEFKKPEKRIEVADEAPLPTMAVKLNLPKKSEEESSSERMINE